MKTDVTFDTKDLWQKDVDHYIHPWTEYGRWRFDRSTARLTKKNPGGMQKNTTSCT